MEILLVDPADLHLPSSRSAGADPYKLQRQIAKHGSSLDGMPPPLVYRGSDGALLLNDGVTRATRAAKLAPGTLISVEVIGTLKSRCAHRPTVKETIP